MISPTALYRHFDGDGRLLYVGISLSAVARLAQHNGSSHWAQDIRRIEVEMFPCRADAETAERHAVYNEKPLHNGNLTTRIEEARAPCPCIGLVPALIERFGTAEMFAAAAQAHPLAPKKLKPASVYMWRRRNVVPFMWRPVVSALSASDEAAA